jgi:hypothetical protein
MLAIAAAFAVAALASFAMAIGSVTGGAGAR